MNESVQYEPVNRCIYCGDTNLPDLSREHIIPFGLGGKLSLPKASCGDCRDVTAAIELACQRGMFNEVRAKLRMPTRRPRERPTSFRVTFESQGNEHERSLPVESHPTMMLLPGLKPPCVLTGETPRDQVYPVGVLVRELDGTLRPEVRELLEEYETDTVYTRIAFNYGIFCQMLAKIAHSFTVAQLGMDGFAPLLLDLILKTEQCDAENYVGGFIGTESKFTLHDGSSQHEMRLHASERFLRGRRMYIVLIQLFADLDAPVYQVVVGTSLADEPEQIPAT